MFATAYINAQPLRFYPFDKVVKLSAGKHEMLLSIESSWVNVDWIKVKSTDPTDMVDVVAEITSGEYKVCDANGKVLGNVTISSKTDFDAKFTEPGVYILVSANGKSIKYVK